MTNVFRLVVRATLAVIASAILAASLVMVGAGPAAAVGCHSEGCDALWPDEQGCYDDRREVASMDMYYTDPPGQATVYVSLACDAAFAEFTLTDEDPPDLLSFQFWNQPQYGGREGLKRHDGLNVTLVEGTTDVYRSVLVNWNYSVKACYTTAWSTPPYDPDPDGDGVGQDGECTRWL